MPEKNTAEIPRDIRDLVDKGDAAVQRENWDYAFLFYNQALQKEPGFFECRQKLRAAQLSKAGRTTSFFKKVLGTAGSSPLIAKAQMYVRKDPAEAMSVCEQILNTDPNNSPAHNMLAQAALNMDLPKTAIFSLEHNRKNNPDDRSIALALANAYVAGLRFANAEAIYHELLQKNRNDTEVATLLKNISANRTLKEGGYESLADGKGSYRDILKNKDEAVALEQEAKQVRSKEQTLKLLDEAYNQLRENPSDLQLAKRVAELYAEAKDYEKALKYYTMLMEIEGVADAAMEKTVTDLKIKKFDKDLAELDKTLPDYEQQKEDLERAKAEFQVEDVKRRVEKYPNDLLIRYEYGVMLFKLARYSEAIQEFQKTQQHASRRISSRHYLAKCFISRGMYDFAMNFLQEAIKDKTSMDDEKKELIYTLADVLEKMGKTEEAIEQLKTIYQVDIGYRDVAAKVDAYYASKQKAS